MAKKNSRPNLAARKSANKKAEAQKLAQQKAFWDAHKKQILTIAAIAVAAIVVLSLAIDYLYVPANTVRTFLGNPIGAKENALIREIDGKYYEMGYVTTPEGYAPADYGVSMTTDENETLFYFVAEEEGKAVESAYTIGVKNRTATAMLDSMATYFNHELQTENKWATIGGHDVYYYYSQGLKSENEPDVYVANMTCYIDSVKDSCVLVSLSSPGSALDALPTEEAMLADAEGIFASLQIKK